jgi:hypothetical protein
VNLPRLFLHFNELSGVIPSSIGNMSKLQYLRLYSNKLTGVPNSLSNLASTEKVLFPNPMSTIPYDVFAQNPSAGLSPTNWTNLFSIPVRAKRQITSALSTEELFKMCPLNNVRDSNVPAGCVVGIYNKFCLNLSDLSACQSSYDTVVAASYFKSLGVCAAWKSGPKSFACASAITSFRVVLDFMTLTSSLKM